jgi:hypothetical protein
MKPLFLLMLVVIVAESKRINTWEDYKQDFGIKKIQTVLRKIKHLSENNTEPTSFNQTMSCPVKDPPLRWINFIEGMFILAILQISFYVPIIEHATRVLLIFISLLCSLYLNKTESKKQNFTAHNMFFMGIFIFCVCAFVEYLVAFMSVERIRKIIEEKRKTFKGFVEPTQEEKEAKGFTAKIKKIKRSLTQPQQGQEPNAEVKVPEEPEKTEVTPAVIKMPVTDYIAKEAATSAKEPEPTEKAVGPKQEFKVVPPKARPSHELKSLIPSPTEIMSKSNSTDPSSGSISTEAYPSGMKQSSQGEMSLSERESRKRKEKERRIRKINNKLHLMYSISHLPADRMARKVFPFSFVMFVFYFWIIYVM